MAEGKCFSCSNFSGYYIKGAKRYESTKLGWCRTNEEIVQSDGGCEHFCQKKFGRTSDRLIKYYLSDILTEISELRKLAEKEYDEKNL